MATRAPPSRSPARTWSGACATARAILVGLILPFGLAGIFCLTLAGRRQAAFAATYAVADLDRSTLTGHVPTTSRRASTS